LALDGADGLPTVTFQAWQIPGGNSHLSDIRMQAEPDELIIEDARQRVWHAELATRRAL
jgi:hypothetical protein